MRKTEFFWRVRAYAGERDTFYAPWLTKVFTNKEDAIRYLVQVENMTDDDGYYYHAILERYAGE